MNSFFKKLNLWFRKILLEDVDIKIDKSLPYYKKFGSRKSPTEKIEKRFNEQKQDNKQY